MGKPQIAVRIPQSLLNELNQYIEKTGTSKTEVVVSALAEYLGCVDSVPLSQRVAELEARITGIETLIEEEIKISVRNKALSPAI